MVRKVQITCKSPGAAAEEEKPHAAPEPHVALVANPCPKVTNTLLIPDVPWDLVHEYHNQEYYWWGSGRVFFSPIYFLLIVLCYFFVLMSVFPCCQCLFLRVWLGIGYHAPFSTFITASIYLQFMEVKLAEYLSPGQIFTLWQNICFFMFQF